MVDSATKAEQYGYSAFGQPFIYIFADRHKNGIKDIAHSIAHEIGHAAFLLEHPIMLTSEAKNLMETSATAYSKPEKNELWLIQWDVVHGGNLTGFWGEGKEYSGNQEAAINCEFTLDEVLFDAKNKFEISDKKGAQWQNEETIPMCFYLNGEAPLISIFPKFKIKCENGELINEVTEIKIEAVFSCNSAIRLGFNEKEEQITESITVNGIINEGYIEINSESPLIFKLGNYVDYYDELLIKWNIFINGKKKQVDAGESKNRIYVTNKEPLLNGLAKNDERLYYYSCRKAKGLNDENEIIDALWDDFEINQENPIGNLYLYKFDPSKNKDIRLTYYERFNKNISYVDILNGKDNKYGELKYDGQCGAFNSLFSNLLSTHSILSNTFTLKGEYNEEMFWIKNWTELDLINATITSKTTGFKYPYISVLPKSEVKFKLTGDLTYWISAFLRYEEYEKYSDKLMLIENLSSNEYNSSEDLENEVRKTIGKNEFGEDIVDITFHCFDEYESYEGDPQGKDDRTVIEIIRLLFIGTVKQEYSTNKIYPDNYNFILSEMKNEIGIAGQGNKNPIKNFTKHFALQINNKGKIYDPSYGQVFNDNIEWQQKSIKAYSIYKKIKLRETVINVDLNHDGDKVDAVYVNALFLD